MLYCQKCEITPILHCKIKLCFCNFFQLLMGSMYQNHNIYHQTGYIQHVKWVLSRIIAIWKLAHFLGVIFEFPPSTYLNNPMVVTSVVTYTFSIGSFVVSPWSRYGPSVDWGVRVPPFWPMSFRLWNDLKMMESRPFEASLLHHYVDIYCVVRLWRLCLFKL